MVEITVPQLHEAFSSVIQQLDEKKDDLNSELDFQIGTSSAFSTYVITINSKINSNMNKLVGAYNSLYKDYVRLSSLYETEILKSDLFENSYSEVSTFLSQMKDHLDYLWSIIAAFAELLLQNESDTREAIELLKSKELKIAELQNNVEQLEGINEWILNHFERVFTAPDFFLNAQDALTKLKNSYDDEKEEKINALEKENEELKLSIEQLKTDFQSKQEEQQHEIDDLKAQNLKLNETIESQAKENQELTKNNSELNDKVIYLNSEYDKKEKMENAIHNFCDAFSFIQFNGSSFDYKVDDVSQQHVLEKTLLSARKENKDLLSQLNELKNEIRNAKKDYEKELQNNGKLLNCEIDALKLQLNQCSQSRDDAILETRQLRSNINQLKNEKIQSEKRVKDISEEFQKLKIEYNEIKSREDSQLALYQENLSHLSQIVKAGTSPKTTALSNFKSSRSSIFSAPLESTPDPIVYKEANETLQKENEDLKNEKKNLSLKIKSLDDKTNELKATNDELTRELNETKDKVANTEKKVNEWKQLYDKLVFSIKKSDPENDSRLSQLEKELKDSLQNSIDLETKLSEITGKLENEKQKNNEQISEIEKLQQELLRKDAKLKKALIQLTEGNKLNDDSSIIAEKDQEIQKLRDDNEEYKKHINLLETRIEINQEKQKQLQQQLQLVTKQVLSNTSNEIDDEKPIPPPESEEPVIRETHEVDYEDPDNPQENQENNEDENNNNEDDAQELEENAENNNEEGSNDEDVEKSKQEDKQESEDNDNNDENAKQENAETKSKEVTFQQITPSVAPTSSILDSHQTLHSNQSDRSSDKGRGRNYLKRSQSVSAEKMYHTQSNNNKKQPQKQSNTNNSNNNQKTKAQTERKQYPKRSNQKRKK